MIVHDPGQDRIPDHGCMFCGGPNTTRGSCCSLYCYLAKEANYGIYDLENDGHYACAEDRDFFREGAIKRLIKFVRFVFEEHKRSI